MKKLKLFIVFEALLSVLHAAARPRPVLHNNLLLPRGIATVILLFVVAFTAGAQQVTEYFSMDEPLVFNDTEYNLAFSAKPNALYLNQEYLPEGETFDDYTSMFTISLLRADLSPEQAVKSKIAELDKRKKSDPVCNYMSINRDDEYMLDFIVSDIPSGDFNTVELDVHATCAPRSTVRTTWYSCSTLNALTVTTSPPT